MAPKKKKSFKRVINQKITQFKSIDEIEKNFILLKLKENNWNREMTAKKIGYGRATLFSRIKKYDKEGYRTK